MKMQLHSYIYQMYFSSDTLLKEMRGEIFMALYISCKKSLQINSHEHVLQSSISCNLCGNIGP